VTDKHNRAGRAMFGENLGEIGETEAAAESLVFNQSILEFQPLCHNRCRLFRADERARNDDIDFQL
jgi:hypothetical protein